MVYKVVVSEDAEADLEHFVRYLLFEKKNEQAAKHLLDGVENVYSRLEIYPEQFPVSRDTFLAKRGYHEAVVPQMDYVIVFAVRSDTVNVVGVFHQSENYQRKI